MLERSAIIVTNSGWAIFRYRLDLMRALGRAGWQVTAAADWRDGHEPDVLAENFQTENIRFSKSAIAPFGDARTFFQLLALFRRRRPHAVQLFHTKPMVFGAIAARLAGVPRIVCTVTGLGILYSSQHRFKRMLFWPLYRLAFGGRVIAVFQNSSDRDQLVASGIARSERCQIVAGSGVDTEALQPDPAIQPQQRNIVIMASRMLWSKGVREFVDAAALLKERFPQIRFVLAGGLGDEFGLRNPDYVDRAFMNEVGARGSVEWLGHQSPQVVEGMFRRAAAVVLPSYYPEGVPRCLIEGAAAGAPIVTSDTPGCRDVVIDGISGYLIPPKSAPRLAEAIAAILQTPGAVASMSAQSRRLAVERFDIGRVFAAISKIYEAE